MVSDYLDTTVTPAIGSLHLVQSRVTKAQLRFVSLRYLLKSMHHQQMVWILMLYRNSVAQDFISSPSRVHVCSGWVAQQRCGGYCHLPLGHFSYTGSAFVQSYPGPGVDVMTASSPALWPDQSKQHAWPRPLHRCTSTKDSKFRTSQACIILTEIIGFWQNERPPAQKRSGELADYCFFFFLWVFAWFGKYIA